MTHDLLNIAERLWIGQMHSEDYPFQTVGVGGGVADLAEGTGMVAGWGNVAAFRTGDGLVLVDTGGADQASTIHELVRGWSADPLRTAIYTHGHRDHVFGVPYFEREGVRTTVVGHDAIAARFGRYARLAGFDPATAGRTGPFSAGRGLAGSPPNAEYRYPDLTYRERLSLDIGDDRFELLHARGETDDATWVWVPERRVLCTGDFITWMTPTAGNPRTVQRYAKEWAAALRDMATVEAEILVPGHGPPILGRDRIRQALIDTAVFLETIHDQTVSLMNEGATLDHILHQVVAPPELVARPYLRPIVDDPQFIVRGIWRFYSGWYDGNPARLKPPRDQDLAAEIARLAGGVSELVDRARQLMRDGNLRLAAHLAEYAFHADRDDPAVRAVRAEVYERRSEEEPSATARGIFAGAAAEARGDGTGATREGPPPR